MARHRISDTYPVAGGEGYRYEGDYEVSEKISWKIRLWRGEEYRGEHSGQLAVSSKDEDAVASSVRVVVAQAIEDEDRKGVWQIFEKHQSLSTGAIDYVKWRRCGETPDALSEVPIAEVLKAAKRGERIELAMRRGDRVMCGPRLLFVSSASGLEQLQAVMQEGCVEMSAFQLPSFEPSA